MKRTRILAFIMILASGWLGAFSLSQFDAFFIDKTMRIDYYHSGDAGEEWIMIDRIYQEGVWAGSRRNMIDTFNNGRYFLKVYDVSSGKLIYSRGFDSYFGEYKTTDSALKGTKRAYHETALIPYPKEKIRFNLEKRDRRNVLRPLFSQEIDPAGINIVRERLDNKTKVFEIVKNGDPHQCVDIAFVAEGYPAEEEAKFESDLNRLADVFFSQEPYRSFQKKFNVYGVYRPSEEKGCDEPTRGVYKNTALDASFNALGSPRYLLTEDNKSLRDIAAHVPYDALLIMVNHRRYGGGGIYNLYCVFTVDNLWTEYLLLHEFGHSFAGLGDEYYTSTVAYNEFYPKGVEPTEPNITALLDPSNIKWKAFLSPGIEIPTPWEKEEYDRMDRAYQKRRREVNEEITRLKREGASEAEIEALEQEGDRLSQAHKSKMEAFFAKSRFKGKVGAFEGAGYSARGLYRPMLDCMMFSRGEKSYCEVCERAIIRMIKHLTD